MASMMRRVKPGTGGADRAGKPPLGQRAQVYLQRHGQNLFGAFGRLLRQPLASLMTVAVIGIALALPAGLHVLVLNAKALGGRWESVVDLSVYLRPDIDQAAAAKTADGVRARDDVLEVELIPADAALEEFRRLSGFGAALDALEENPLPAALIVRPAADARGAESVAALAAALAELPETDLVQLDTQWVKRFHALLDVVRRAVYLAAVLLALAVIIIVGNTIRLDIENRRDEIEITKLIGGSDGFIRRPFLYGGLWYGLAGGLMALLLVQAVLWLLKAPVRQVAGLYGSSFSLTGLPPAAMGLLVGGGTLLGWLGSWVVATRHMRRIEPS